MQMRRRPDRTVRVPIGPCSNQSGMVTAEFAVVLPAIVFALTVGLVAVATFAMRVRCSDAAQVGARLAARGEPASEVISAATRVAPPGARVHVAVRGDEVEVSVDAVARPPVLGGLLPGFDVSGSFSEPVEPGPPP